MVCIVCTEIKGKFVFYPMNSDTWQKHYNYHEKTIHIKPHGIESKTVAVGYYTSSINLFILDCINKLSKTIKTKYFIVQEIVK